MQSSNLCTEIVQYTSADEISVCNLASISLGMFVKSESDNISYDYTRLYEITKIVTKNLNKVIDRNHYPVQESRNSNMRHRPIGIGIQGLADAFIKMKVPYESQAAYEINEKIFETIYYAACETSMEIAKIDGPYESFKGSPASKGILQFDMWNKTPTSGYDWDSLKEQIKIHGMRNSLLVAPMPTASTSQILGNNESFEPYTSNLYTRRVLAGEFVCINPHLVNDLINLNLWNPQTKNKLIQFNGSVQNIEEIPQNIKNIYKTVWEISQKTVINLAAGRGPYIDQSQSLNIHLSEPNQSQMSTMHFYGWKAGLKTGMYYLRSRPAADAIKFTLEVENLLKEQETVQENIENEKYQSKGATPSKKVKLSQQKYICTDEICTSCGS